MGKKPNHLVNEKSPYLIQHAYNPVDWYPWGDPAIEKARREDRPILLSIGYSTCHWCHVMEKESFENEDIARFMNQHFVCIKVDREERPDLDGIYMTAVTVITGSGGWPLNVFLTPDLKPFFGGTYFPVESRHQMISWPDLLARITEIWDSPLEREKLRLTGEEINKSISKYLAPVHPGSADDAVLDSRPIEEGIIHYISQFDDEFGGFSKAPKFPSPVVLNFLMAYYEGAKTRSNEHPHAGRALRMVKKTLSAMAGGGIFDQLGGGFHRYSTDRSWHIPHFEKMLYDNAQLITTYIDAYQMTREDEYREIAGLAADYVMREMQHAGGGFYSGEDADSPVDFSIDPSGRKEGAFYVWRFDEVRDILDKETFEVAAYRYGIKPDGNAKNDPHGEFVGQNILFSAHSLKETADRFGSEESVVKKVLEHARARLLSVRNHRSKPHLDDKILTSWNGLMVSALARLYQATGNDAYLETARDAAMFIQRNLYDPNEKILYRRWREGERKIFGLSEDYALMIQGLIDLYESDFQWGWLDFAIDLAEMQVLKFYDNNQGGFFMTEKEHDEKLIVRIKDENDGVIPSANSVSAINFLRLSRLFDRDDFDRLARRTIGFFSPKINQFPGAMPQMLIALQMAVTTPVQIVVVGEKSSEKTRALLKEARSGFSPGKTIVLIDNDQSRSRIAEYLPFVREMASVGGSPTAYVCREYRCLEPVNDPERLRQSLTL